jgi:immune inhibitor A
MVNFLEGNSETLMKSTVILIFVIILSILAICCISLVGVGVISYYVVQYVDQGIQLDPGHVFEPTPTVVITRPPLESIPTDTLETLETSIVPNNDISTLACRLQAKCNIPKIVAQSAVPLQIGDQVNFWVNNMDTNENLQVSAILRSVTEHAYFWVEDGVDYDPEELTTLADTFEQKIYPTTREFFGSEWTPGVDGDPHIYILYATGLGNSIAGYFSSADENNPLVQEYSNGHEMFIFNADNSNLSDPFTFGVLAHEFQHMIHWNVDRDETSWLNEGFSELSGFLNGFDPGGFDFLYIQQPDLQLNDWPNDPDATSPHYGAGFLFTTYFLDRFGEDATRALVADPLNGLESVDNTLESLHVIDPLTEQPVNADDFFLDWTITNYLQDASVADGRFAIHDYQNAPHIVDIGDTEKINDCPQTVVERTVHQYGADYIGLKCAGDFTMSFEGSTVTRLLPEDPYSGKYAYWSNKGDESDMTLTRQFDFSEVSSPGLLSFRTWYDLEQDYDYLYLEASTDGETWQILKTPSGTDQDPSGNSLGWAYNGTTNGWIQESIDLSLFAGQKVFLRFEYVTDAAVNGEGFLLEDVSIPSIDYFTDFEQDDGGWQPEGFVRIQNSLPQTFRLALISIGSQTSVQIIPVNPDQTAEIPIHIDRDVTKVVLVVTGTTRYTRQLASYQYEIH